MCEILASLLCIMPFVSSAPYLTLPEQLTGVQECLNCFEDKDPADPQWMELLKKTIDGDSNPKVKEKTVDKIIAVRSEELAGSRFEFKFLSNSPVPNAQCEAQFTLGYNSGKPGGVEIKCDDGTGSTEGPEED